mgnify:CR=1 FL=1
MNEHDRSNVNFIMSLNERQFDEWASDLTDDDIEYAIEIIKLARAELDIEKMLLDTEHEVEDLTLAKQFLQKFTLH